MTLRERLAQNPAAMGLSVLLVLYGALHVVLAVLSTGAMQIALGGIAVGAALVAAWGLWVAMRR